MLAPRLKEFSLGDRLLLGEGFKFGNDLGRELHVVLGVEQFELEVLQIKALHFGQRLASGHGLSRLDVERRDATGEPGGHEGVPLPGRNEGGVSENILTQGTRRHFRGLDVQQVAGFAAEGDDALFHIDLGAFRRQGAVARVRPH